MTALRRARLEEVAQVFGGGTPSRQESSYFGGGIAWATPTDVTALDGLYLRSTRESVTEEGLRSSSTKLLPAGAVLLTSRATIGFTAVADIPVCTNQGFVNFVCGPELVPEFLAFWLRTQKAKMLQHAGGTTFKEIARGVIRKFEIAYPSVQEQRRSVDLLTRAEGIVRLRREAAAKAAELIPALFIHHFGDPATNPMGWPQCTLGDVVNIASGGTPSKARPDFWEGDLPWVSPKDMKRTVIVDAIDHISPKVVEKTNLKLVPKDAVLIVVRGMILAHTVPIAITARPVTINQDMKALTAKEGVMPAFLLWHLKVMHHELLGATSTAAHGTKKLETKDLLRQPVVVPPLALQGQFCEQMMAMESIQRQQIDALAKAQASFDALLAQAFAPA